MIREMATLRIDPANRASFEAAVTQAIAIFRGTPGCQSMRLERSVDEPGRYVLIIGWESVDAHMVGFRQSEAFQAWRGLVGGFFTAPPEVDHVEQALVGF